MLQIILPAIEQWDELKEEFVTAKKELTLELEHSLVSLSKWESRWKKAFLSKRDKSYEETIDYIKCMTITKNVPPDAYQRLTMANVKEINDYINDSMTATYIHEDSGGAPGKDQITAELIYFWMITLNIPFECKTWHLNRLLTLIRLCSAKNQPPKKRNARDTMSQYAALNAARRNKLNTKG